MRNVFILAATLCILCLNEATAQVKPGIKVALNYSSIESEYFQDTDNGVGYSIGGFLDVPVSNAFHLEPTLLYSVKRDKAMQEGITNKIRFNYLDLPLLMRFYVADGFNLFIGPQMSVNLDGKMIAESEGIQVKSDLPDVEEVLFGINLGMGYKLASGLNLQVGYEYEWTGSLEKVDGLDPNAHIGSLQLSAAYAF
ncbi:porin family protein [Roseivirga sp. BDSF3-8]|uniref:porin family protein n=1 Tax=Roseivirga sp. BDSF3-8 TaxID=3241598 RepID=UPI0035320BD6